MVGSAACFHLGKTVITVLAFWKVLHMPRLSLDSRPGYRHHRPSGQAVVTLSGEDHYLGPFNSKASRDEYKRKVGEWEVAGCAPHRSRNARDLTISELCNAYRKYAEGYFVKNGKQTATVFRIKAMITYLRESYAKTPAREFGPLALQAMQKGLAAKNLSRSYVNDLCDSIKAMFRWGSNQELVPPSVYHALQPVPGLKRGRTKARETEPVGPVADHVVEATLPKLPRIIADMVRIQRYCGCRPGEICQLRPGDLDRAGAVWCFMPASHKTEHHGRERRIYIGPQAQAILCPYLLRGETYNCFQPCESESERNKLRREQRQSPLTPSQKRRKAKRKPERTAGDCYTADSYRRAITRACDLLDRAAKQAANDQAEAVGESPPYSMVKGEKRLFPEWSPNQLRHSAATLLRDKFGIEAAQLVLGHSDPRITLVYAERNFAAAAKIMGEVG